MGELFLIATPIGNLADFSLRAQRILNEVDIIFAEDTRRTKRLLDFFKIEKKRILSFYRENETKRTQEAIFWLKEGKKIALLSDAGSPLISDPGVILLRAALSQDIKVVSIPGPSSLIVALSLAGFSCNRFLFLGFISKKHQDKKRLFKTLKEFKKHPFSTVVFYDSPLRLVATLEVIREVFGNIPLVVCRELTKKFEEVIRGRVNEVLIKLKEREIKGEITVVISLKK